jgi:sugar phosphate isomerase/epimerase
VPKTLVHLAGSIRNTDVLTQPGIPNGFSLSTTCYGSRLKTIEDQAFATVAMGFRRLEIGVAEVPITLNGFEQSRRETGIEVRSLVAGCLDTRTDHPSGGKLGSLDEDMRERALNCVRRHIRLAHRYECPIVVVRGCEVEDRHLQEEIDRTQAKLLRDGVQDETRAAMNELAGRVRKKGQRQIEHLCRSLHTLASEFPETRIAIETGTGLLDLLGFEAVGWVLEDLANQGIAYWHDTGRSHLREKAGLGTHGQWLDSYAGKMVGVHLEDAADGQAEMPPGTGEVDFRLVAGYVPKTAEKVLEINPRHGRAEILAAVQFLVDLGI